MMATTILMVVTALKILFKLTLVLVIGAAIAGVVVMSKRSQTLGPTSYEQWPDVPENPAA